MKNNVALAMSPLYIVNLTTLEIFSFSLVIVHKLSKYFKLAEIVMFQVIHFVKDERYFNNLKFIKSKFGN
jgi:hypothetical protein